MEPVSTFPVPEPTTGKQVYSVASICMDSERIPVNPFLTFCGAVLLLVSPYLQASDLKPDEEIIYFPTSGSWDETSDTWHVPLHGWIFEAERDSLWRQGALAMLKQGLGLGAQSNHSHRLQERGWPFLVDNERGKAITIRIAGNKVVLPESGANGHLYDELSVRQEISGKNTGKTWLIFETVMPEDDPRQFEGAVQLLGSRGLSVVSDIDDTIKLSNVLDKEELLANTFLRDFQAIPGMAELYTQWEASGAAFHYVTGSPWQLYPTLSDFLATNGFPRGSFTMRNFRLKDSSFLDFLSSAEEFKVATLTALLQRYPKRHFILVGDSGEKDPEVYGAVARRFPEQVTAIYIRNVTAETADSPRMKSAFTSIPTKSWYLFTDPTKFMTGN